MKKLPAKPSLSPVELRTTSYVVTLLLFYFLVVDSFGSARTVYKLTGFESQLLIIPAFLVLFYVRLRIGHVFSLSLEKFFKFALLFLSGVTAIFTLVEVVAPPNTVFALTRLHVSQLWVLSLVVLGLCLLNQSTTWWQKHWRRVLFWLPFGALLALLLAYFFPFDFFDQLIKEDRVMEYGQFLVLLAGAVWCAWHASRDFMRAKLAWGGFFLLCAAALALVAGDEIAWGQRLLGLEVSETVKTLNRQEELTIHNLHAVEWLVAFAYAGLSLFGVIGRFVVQKVAILFSVFKPLVQFAPTKMLFGYFCLPLVFYIAQLVVPTGIWHQWSEVAELSLYSGIVLWLGMINDRTPR